MRTRPLHRPAGTATAAPANGAKAAPAAAVPAPEATAWPRELSIPAQLCTMAAVLAGVWVAISPWFLTLQAAGGRNAAVADLVVGLAVAAIGLLTLTGSRSLPGLQAASLLAGLWMIIFPFILDAKVHITAAMYWSNIWSGALIMAAAALAATALARPVLARSHAAS